MGAQERRLKNSHARIARTAAFRQPVMPFTDIAAVFNLLSRAKRRLTKRRRSLKNLHTCAAPPSHLLRALPLSFPLPCGLRAFHAAAMAEREAHAVSLRLSLAHAAQHAARTSFSEEPRLDPEALHAAHPSWATPILVRVRTAVRVLVRSALPSRAAAALSDAAVPQAAPLEESGAASAHHSAFALRVRVGSRDPVSESRGFQSPPPSPLGGPPEPGGAASSPEEGGEEGDRLGTLSPGYGDVPGRGGGPGEGSSEGAASSEAPRPLPFEFLVLEHALESVCSRLEADVRELELAAHPALDALTTAVTRLNLERVKRCRSNLSRLTTRVTAVRAELQRLLDDDSDMRDMHLTRKHEARAQTLALWLGRGATGSQQHAAVYEPVRAAETLLDEDDDLQELEDLLETYFAQIDHASNRLLVLRQVIEDTEDYVNIELDSTRNKILEFNVLVGLAALAQGLASNIFGVFGMNFILPTDSGAIGNLGLGPQGAFRTITILTFFFAVFIWLAMVATLRRYGMVHIVPLPQFKAGCC